MLSVVLHTHTRTHASTHARTHVHTHARTCTHTHTEISILCWYFWPPNERIFSILQSDNVLLHFALGNSSSQVDIVTNAVLDYEKIVAYEIMVTASDNGDPSLSRLVSSGQFGNLVMRVSMSLFPYYFSLYNILL